MIEHHELTSLAETAMDRLRESLETAGECLSREVLRWIETLRPDDPAGAYFLDADAFPHLRFPVFAERALCGRHVADLQVQLAFSSINGYYHIRLIDNLMDGNATAELQLLPALGVFHTNFQTAYLALFDAEHPFWRHFRQYWFATADVTIRDAKIDNYDMQKFVEIASRKTCAAMIPVAAVLHHYGRPELIEPWAECIERFGRWHQLYNDLVGWLGDRQRGTTTYFLAEARRRRHPGEPVESWVVREGYHWAADLLADLMSKTKAAARPLKSPELDAYLEMRETGFAKERRGAESGFERARVLLASLSTSEDRH